MAFMGFVDVFFFVYIFLGLYMLLLFIFLWLPNRDELFDFPKGKIEAVSIVMPCYNEGEHIGKAIESLLKLDYPKDMIEIIVVDDKSKDNSVEIIKKYTEKYKNVRLIVNKRNSGGAAEPTNIGIMAAKYNYIAVADSDSTPRQDALKKMIGFLQNDKKVAAVTCSVLSKEPVNFIQGLQATEYAVIAFGRKLLDLVDAVYVTPGPFALYKKQALMEVGLFDAKNITQDIEIVWRLMSHGYKARMSLATYVLSATPLTFRKLWRQRVRWSIGGIQTLIKYKKELFKKEMLGLFVIPFFSISMFLGLFGLGIFCYLFLKRVVFSYLATKYSLYASTAVLNMQDLTFTPSVLNFFGAVLFILGLAFALLSLGILKVYGLKRESFFNILFYSIIYLAIQPVLLVAALFKMARGKYSW